MLVITGGKTDSETYSDRGWELYRGDTTLYQRHTTRTRWGYLRPKQTFYGNPGDHFTLTASIRNYDAVNDSINPYVRLTAYIGPISAPTRKMRTGYTVPPQPQNGYYTYSLPFELQAGENQITAYLRLYSGGTTVDMSTFQLVKTRSACTTIALDGRGDDSVLATFPRPVTSESGSATGFFSPAWGCQETISVRVLAFLFSPQSEITGLELWYEAVAGFPTIEPSTGFSIYQPNGRFYVRLITSLDTQDTTLVENLPINHARLNREYRRDIVAWRISASGFAMTYYGTRVVFDDVSFLDRFWECTGYQASGTDTFYR
jgi:hypothetical protein